MKRALVGVRTIPEPDRQSGDRRIADHVDLLAEQGFAVTVASLGASGDGYADELKGRGFEVHADVAGQLEPLISAGQFDLALLPFWDVAETWLPALRSASPSTRVLVDSVDLHFVREARAVFHAARYDPSRSGLDREYGRRVVRELNVYASADRVLTVSHGEAAMVAGLTGEPSLAVTVPDFASLPASSLEFDRRRGVLFVANFLHSPNVAALDLLCDEIAPRLSPAFLADHPIGVIGNALDQEVASRCRRAPGVEPVGWVPSVATYLGQARVSIAPLTFGAGTKRKLLEALTAGTPVVTTAIGAEGLPLVDGEHAIIADDPAEFARGIERVAVDEKLWARLRDAGLRAVQPDHTREAAAEALGAAVAAAWADPPKQALRWGRVATRSHSPRAGAGKAAPGRPPDTSQDPA